MGRRKPSLAKFPDKIDALANGILPDDDTLACYVGALAALQNVICINQVVSMRQQVSLLKIAALLGQFITLYRATNQ